MERQYCASAYVIDLENETILLMYNSKLNKWLQPGGHIEGYELPSDTAKRETLEETGWEIEIKGELINKEYQPFATAHYVNKVGDMIDIQYFGIPVVKKEESLEKNPTCWCSINNPDKDKVIDEEILDKAKYLVLKHK